MPAKGKKLTDNQAEFMRIVESYSGIADNGNVMFETGWVRQKVVAVGQKLVKLGLLTYGRVSCLGFEGGVWEKVKP